MVLRAVRLVTLLLLSTSEVSDDLVPPNLEHSTAFGCWVYGDADGTANAKVVAQYSDGTREYIALYAKRGDATTANEDCIEWHRHVKDGLREAQRRKDATRSR